jgi:RNA polymerase sigma-70 factor (ECF subfamily)
MASADRDEFAEQIVRNQRRIFAYIVTLLVNRDDAEDVFQSTCLILWRKWGEFDAGRDFFSWACGVAHNEVRNLLRRRRPQRRQLSEDLLAQISAARLKADKFLELRSQFLAMCLEKLPEGQRRLVELCYLGDRPIKAVAAELGISPAALTMRLQRIRKTLSECMDLAARKEAEDSP